MSHHTPFSPPNDPADPIQNSPIYDRPPQQFPASPPTSTSPSQFDASGTSSPHNSAFTPATAPFMSADPSQQGFSPSSESLPHEILQGVQGDKPRAASPGDQAILRTEPQSIVRTSSKHRLADDESKSEPNKRRRTDHDRDDIDNAETKENVSAEPGVGQLYKVANMPLSISRPHPSLNLLSLYGLDALSSSVARIDPVSGEKINKLRKSYEGKIKDLPGRNKAVTRENDLFNLLRYPPDDWEIHHVQGKEIAGALSPDEQDLSKEFMASLDSALNMAPGPLPQEENENWRGIISLDSTAQKAGAAQSQVPPKPDKGRPASNAASPTAEPLRPRRRGTKRNYHDDSFEGYGDFGEDLGETMSIDDDDHKSTTSSTAKKRRRKESGSASHFAGSMSQFSHTVSVGGNSSR